MVRFRARAMLLTVTLAAGWAGAAAIGLPEQLMQPGQRLRTPTGTATVAGTVVDSAQPPRPVRLARVTLREENGGNGWSATTDDDGRFALTGIAAGRYVLEAKKAAWVTGRYGAARPGRPGIPLVVNDGATVQGLKVAMSRGAAISGIVLSRSGEPMPGVMVTATGARLRDSGTDVTTDDEGRFRLFGLPAGEYQVLATPTWRSGPASSFMDLTSQTEAQVNASLRGVPLPAAGTVGYASVYAPGVVSRAQAMTIKLSAEEERDGVTIELRPVPTARITVSLDVGDAADPASVRLSLVPADAGSLLTGRRGGDGRYVFTGVPPVPYTVMARAARLGASPVASAPAIPGARGAPTGPLTMYAIEDLPVTGGEMNVSLRLQPAMTVSGRVMLEAGAPTAMSVSDVSFALIPVRETPALGVTPVRSNSSGVFVFEGGPPGRYRLTPAGTTALDMKSAMSQGVDVLDALLDVRAGEDVSDLVVTLPARPTELLGRLETAAGVAAPDYFIVAFAADRQFWTPQSRRIRQTRPANDGNFSIKGLPAGDYLLAALTDVERDEWFDPAFLAQLVPAAVRVRLSDGGATTQNLRIR